MRGALPTRVVVLIAVLAILSAVPASAQCVGTIPVNADPKDGEVMPSLKTGTPFAFTPSSNRDLSHTVTFSTDGFGRDIRTACTVPPRASTFSCTSAQILSPDRYQWRVEADDGRCTPLVSKSTDFTVCGNVTQSPATFSNGTVGTAYPSTILSGSGGPTTAYTFSITAGALPPGLTLSSGVISGTPTRGGTFNFTITTNSGGCTDVAARSITIACPTLSMTPGTVPAATVGTAYSTQTFTASGTAGTFTYTATGSLPPGLTLSGNTLGGTPTAPGTYAFSITGTNSTANCSVTNPYSIKVCGNVALSARFPSGTTGTAYRFSPTIGGGVAPYTFAIVKGGLPPGLTMSSSTGEVSGTPTTAGSFQFSIRGTDSQGCSDAQDFFIDVAQGCGTITIGPAAIPPANVGSDYKVTLTPAGGTAPYKIDVVGLPAGLTFDGSSIVGNPKSEGSFPIEISVLDARDCTGSRKATITVNPPDCKPITVGPPSVGGGSVGEAIPTQSLTATGGTGPYSFTITGNVPPGLSLKENQFGGTPTTVGTFTFTITATDANRCQGSTTYTMTISPPKCPTITVDSAGVPDGTVGTAYRGGVTASGGAAPHTFALAAGSAMPPGMSLDPSGAFSGVPTTPGIYRFTITATDANSCAGSGSVSLTINPAACPSILVGGVFPAGQVGSGYKADVETKGGAAPFSFGLAPGSSGLPPGLTLSPTGTVSGTPTAAGKFTFTIAATDANKCTGTGSVTIEIAAALGCPSITVGPPSFPNGELATFYKVGVSAAGGAAPYSYTVTNGVLPAGISLSGDTISGTPNTTGKFTFTITATDANRCSGATTYSIEVVGGTVCPTLRFAPGSLPSLTVGDDYKTEIVASGGTAPYTYVVSGGALPDGFTLSSTGGFIGTAKVAGGFKFTVTATDANRCVGSMSYTMDVAPAGTTCNLTLGPPTLPAGTVGAGYRTAIVAAGGAIPYAYEVTGALPPGLSLSGDTIVGTPTTAGTFRFGIVASDAKRCSATVSYSLTIAPAASPCPTGAPSLVSPVNVSVDGSRAVSFSWNPVKGALGYDVLVSDDGGATFGIATSTSGELATTANALLKAGKVVWVVRANFGPDCKPTNSGPASFEVTAAAGCPTAAPTPVSPAQGASNVATTVVFEWTLVKGATLYRLLLSVDGGPANPVGSTTDNVLKLEIPTGKITWFVEAVFPGCPSTRSAPFTFTTTTTTTTCSTTPEATKLIAPANGAANVGSPVNFQWSAVNGATGYRVSASVNGGPSSILGTVTETTLSASLPQGTIVWFVETLFGRCPSSISARNSFSVASGTVCNNPATTLVAPANGASGVQSPVTFSWNAVKGAVAYHLFLSTNSAPFSLAAKTTETKVSQILAPGTVDWFVATEFAGCDPVKSSTSRFSVDDAAAARCSSSQTIALTAPAAGAAVSSPVAFNWTTVDGAASYRLFVSVDGNTPVAVARTTTPGASVQLPSGKIVAFVEASFTTTCPPVVSPSITFSVQQASTCATNRPVTLVAPVSGSVSSPVDFTWSATPGASAYRLFIAGDGQPFGDAGTTKETHLLRDLSAGKYSWLVETLFEGCTSLKSNPASFEIAPASPRCSTESPALISPADGATNTSSPVTFLWSSVTGAAAYRVYASVNGDPPYLIAQVDGSENSVTSPVPPGTTVWYVEAVFKQCASMNSTRSKFTIARSNTCPNEKPQLLTPRNNSDNVTSPVTFSWTPISGATKYVLFVKTDTGVPTPLGESVGTTLERPVPLGSTIEWWVIAFVPGCAGIESDHFFFFVPAPPTCDGRGTVLLTPLEGTVETSQQVRFSWTPVPKANGYRLYLSSAAGGEGLAYSGPLTEVSLSLPEGLTKWYVDTIYRDCPPVSSAGNLFTVSTTRATTCDSPAQPVAYAIGKALSGTPYNFRFVPVAGAASYDVQESATADFAKAASKVTTDTAVEFTHTVGQETPYYYRVRANSACRDEQSPFSLVVVVNVVPPDTIQNNRKGTAEIGVVSSLEQTLFIPGDESPISFTAQGDKPWMIITPSSGILPPEGLTLTIKADPSFLGVGSNDGTVLLTYGGAGAGKPGQSANATKPGKVPVNVSLVTPVVPGGKNGPQLDSLIIPAVAHAQGANNALFQSDVRVVNTSAQTMKYQLNFTPSRTDGTVSGSSTTIQIESGGTAALNDVLASFFGTATSDRATGTLEVRPLTASTTSTTTRTGPSLASPTVASSRTYNLTTNGTFGQFVPAVKFANFIGKNTDGTRAVLSMQQIAESAAYRTNVGLVEASGAPAEGIMSVFDARNSLVAEIPFSLQAAEHQQLDRLLFNNGITLEEGRIEVEVTSATGKVTSYASTIDNRTNDPLLVTPVLKSSVSSTRYVIPGVAYIDGAAKWRSDIRLYNAGNTATEATITFFPQNDPLNSQSQQVTINPGAVFSSDNVLNTMFGVTAPFVGGSLLVTTPQTTSLIATARTYAQTDNGTYGQFVPAVTPAESIGLGSNSLNVLQVEQSVNMRTNIGLVETTGKTVMAEVSLVLPDSKVTPKVQIPMEPNSFKQFSVSDFGVSDAVYNARVTVKVISGSGKVSAYGSVIDNKTADPTYVPAQ